MPLEFSKYPELIICISRETAFEELILETTINYPSVKMKRVSTANECVFHSRPSLYKYLVFLNLTSERSERV